MLTEEEQKKVADGEITVLYHKIHGKGEVEMTRVDKLNDNRFKSEILFTVQDLLDEIKRPEFLFLDDPNLSTKPWE